MTTRIYLQMTFFPKYFFDVDNIFKIGVWLLYSVVLISAKQQPDSALSVHTPHPSEPPSPAHPIPLGHHRAPS